jgi:anaerobic selenocysteine-containing dehydrogenase
MSPRTLPVTCPLCEATCGLSVTLDDGTRPGRVVAVRGDADDVFSKGYLCPKGVSLAALQDDPDRLRAPLVKRDGRFVEASWEDAFAEVERRLAPILAAGPKDSVAVYIGNPAAHNLSLSMYGRVLVKALGTRNVFSASTVDQMPKHVSAGLMFGHPLAIPVPDLDRTDWLLMLGANPLASNGSLMTAPDMRGRLRAIQRRGGRVIVVDPRRSRTAELADEHHFVRPGTDALLLFAVANVLIADGLARPGRLAEHLAGLDELTRLAAPFTPEAVAPACGVPAEVIRRLTHELAGAKAAAVYGRIGTTTQAFGTLTSWLVDVLNTLTGNLDRAGGAMFTTPAASTAAPSNATQPFELGRWRSRVRKLPEVMGEFPVATLADEIETPGEGQVRALITLAGNPCVSTPNAGRLAKALQGLDFMLSIDVYVNETTRQADVILPGPSPLERGHYDLLLYQFAVRNVANWTPPVLESSVPPEWETLLRLTAIVRGMGRAADTAMLDDSLIGEQIRREVDRAGGPLAQRDPAEVLAALAPRSGPERVLDFMLRIGPYGDHLGARADGLSLAALERAPHGVDLGPLEARVPQIVRTASGKIELVPQAIAADIPRLVERLASRHDGMVLVGRRHLRSNNSWMHNLEPLVGGHNRCTAHVHPADAHRLGLVDGAPALVRSRAGEIEVPVEITDAVMPGVVSVPHGWGHDVDSVRLSVARAHAGANSNLLADEQLIDPLSGNAVLNGIPITLTPVAAERSGAEATAAAVAYTNTNP